MNDDFAAMEIPPQMSATERLIDTYGGKTEDSAREDFAIALTSERIYISPRHGRELPEGYEHFAPLDLPLNNIRSVRRAGLWGKEIEIETEEGEVIELPRLGVGLLPTSTGESGKFCSELVDTAGLVERELEGVSQLKKSDKVVRVILPVILGIIGLLLSIAISGFAALLFGIMKLGAYSFGTIISIVVVIAGVIITGIGGIKLILHGSRGQGFGHQHEWVKKEHFEQSKGDEVGWSDYMPSLPGIVTAARITLGLILIIGSVYGITAGLEMAKEEYFVSADPVNGPVNNSDVTSYNELSEKHKRIVRKTIALNGRYTYETQKDDKAIWDLGPYIKYNGTVYQFNVVQGSGGMDDAFGNVIAFFGFLLGIIGIILFYPLPRRLVGIINNSI